MKKIGFVQNYPIFGEKEKNFAQIEHLLNRTENADLIVLPELFATGYTFESKNEAKELAEVVGDGITFGFLKKMSHQKNAVVVAGYVEKEGDSVYNSCMMVYKNQLIGNYRKLHLFGNETQWYDKGNLALNVYEINGMKIGMMICYDWFFPEVARTLMLKGAEVVAHPCNLVMPYCPDAMVTRCLENKIFAITANRIGEEERAGNKNFFIGKSQITSFDGEKLFSAPKNTLSTAFEWVDLSLTQNKNINPFNNIVSDRRVEFFIN
jgi:predicted amidohydrolase